MFLPVKNYTPCTCLTPSLQRVFFLLCLFCINLQTTAQDKSSLNPLFKIYTDNTDQTDSTTAYFITVWKESIPKTINPIRQVNDRIAIISSNQKKNIPANLLIHTAPANNKWKLSTPSLAERKKDQVEKITIGSNDLDSLLNALKKYLPTVPILHIDTTSRSAIIQCNKNEFDQLLQMPAVTFLDIPARPHTEIGIIGYDRSFHDINLLGTSVPGANGKNIVVGVKEQKMQPEDLDLYKRVLPSSIEAVTTENHATVISSIIGGAGNSFYDGLGIAPACLLFPSSFNNLFADDAAILNSSKVTVQNHSYGTIIQQFYGAEALSYDALSWNNKNIIPVFSAGNKGTDYAADGPYASLPGYANLTGNFKMAKNSIIVGAVNNTGVVAQESSAGPAYDGRITPQLVALGPNGTSDAAAMVSGTIAVLQQVYADSNNQTLPPSSLIKAILYNTASDLHNKGIDHKTGYGLLNTYNAVQAIRKKNYILVPSISQGQAWTGTITIPPNTAQIKITLAWTDPPAALNNHRALTNDLDISLTDLNSRVIYLPWVLSSFPDKDSLVKEPQRTRDSLNTAEQVSIRLPNAGLYQVTVRGTDIISSPLPFSIAYTIDTLHTFQFTSPQQASDLDRQESDELNIRWRTQVADSNETGSLYISYNKGSNWELIAPSIKLYTGQYRWLVKDTSSIATLKMETPFGNFFSPDFVISKVTRPQLDFVCSDSFRISWGKHVYANAYRIFALVDSPYLKPIRDVSDTFVVLHRSSSTSLVYAVQPLLSNNLVASRSVALNIELQGVQCFYRTLNYVLQNGNRLDMQLELSVGGYADSIFFERVTSGGILLQTLGGEKASSSQLIYNQSANDIPSGTIYIRSRIRLTNGVMVYTDIIPVLSSGPELIVFYPNPASRAETLKYVLRQGVAPDSRLQIYDLSGRIVKTYVSLPATINLSGLIPGYYMLKLSDPQGKELQVSKLIVF